jgi:hypothetical protein
MSCFHPTEIISAPHRLVKSTNATDVHNRAESMISFPRAVAIFGAPGGESYVDKRI